VTGLPTGSVNAFIQDGTAGLPTVVTLGPGGTGVVGSLTVGANNTLDVAQNSSLEVLGPALDVDGSLNVSAGSGTNSELLIGGNVTLSGLGELTLSYGDHNGTVYVEESGGSYTLTNQGSIQGDGVIGNGGLVLVNASGGLVDANVSGQTLLLNGGGITNAGIFEATGGGVLQFSASVANAAGLIAANGGTVVVSSTVSGGRLFTSNSGVIETGVSATLAGVTLLSGTTYLGPGGTTTALEGVVTNNGTLQANSGSGATTTLELTSDVTLQGGGTLTLDSGDANGLVYLEQSGGSFTLTNSDNLIQGYGVIGNGGLSVANAPSGVINADVNGRTLLLNGTGGIVNTGVLEASAGGTLQVSTAVANGGGTILGGSGTVNLSADVEGGLLQGTLLQTVGAATLDGTTEGVLTLDAGGVYTGPRGSTTTLLGTLENLGQVELIAGSGSSTTLALSSNVTLEGGGTVTLDSGDGNGSVYLSESAGGVTLTNVDNLIQGYGILGNGGLALLNAPSGVINANVNGRTLLMNGTGGTLNSGLLEATGGGELKITNTVANARGTILSNAGTVLLDGGSTVEGGSLASENGGFLGTDGVAVLDGSASAVALAPGSTWTGERGSTTTLLGILGNEGTVDILAGSGSSTVLAAGSDLTLQGGGTVTLDSGDGNGAVSIGSSGGSHTLTNVDNLIQGYGAIGAGALALVNEAGGVVDANVGGRTLTLGGLGGVVNGGLLEATGGGVLQLSTTVANGGGTLGAATGTVNLSGTLEGGVLTGGLLGTVGGATLDGTTEGALTLAAGSTYTGPRGTTTTLLGTLDNAGTLLLFAGSGNNTTLAFGSTVTLQGGGTVTLDSGDGNGSVYLSESAAGVTLTNLDNLVQGYGVIGNGGLSFTNAASGVVNANIGGRTLTLNGSGGIVNAGTLEASGSGVLQVSTPVANAGGTLAAATGTVDLSSTVQGGTLSGTLFQTNGSATLDGSTLGLLTLAAGGAYTGGRGTTTSLTGTIENQGNLQFNAGSGNNTLVDITGNTTLQGGGTVTLNNGDNNGRPYLQQSGGSYTLTNVDNTVLGAGTIGNGALSFVNGALGTVEADLSGQTLVLNGGGGLVNTGFLEAAGGGVLQVTATVANAGGVVLSDGGTVLVDSGGRIQGGTLEGLSGGIFETDGTAALDGGASPLTVAAGTTWTGTRGTTTVLLGTIVNQGNLLFDAGSGNNTFLNAGTSVTLEGGGDVTLNSGDGNGQAYLQESTAGLTVANVDNTVEGYGTIGNGGLSFSNGASGTVVANVAGRTLVVNASGAVANSGTFEADGGTLSVVSALSNFSGSTLTGGTWEASAGGTLSFEGAANAVAVNDATLILDGSGSVIRTRTGAGGSYQQVEQTLTTNNGTLIVSGGRSFSATNTLVNAGVIQLGGGTLSAPSLSESPGSVLSGTGTVSTSAGLVLSGGAIVSPGVAQAGERVGTLSFAGNLTLGSGGIYSLDIMNAPGAVAGTDNDTLGVSGNLQVSASPASPFVIALSSVDPSQGLAGPANFDPTQGYTWTIATAGSLSGFNASDFTVATGLFQNPLDGGSFLVGSNGAALTLQFVPVPEPGTWALILLGLPALGISRVRRRLRA
jgi:hypothetical protein